MAGLFGQEFLEEGIWRATLQPFPGQRWLGQLSGTRHHPQRDIVNPQGRTITSREEELAGGGDGSRQEHLAELGPLSRLPAGRQSKFEVRSEERRVGKE